jgi:UDP-glucose:(heptosyl)LPS alpha-1,3-glucosyltransferase
MHRIDALRHPDFLHGYSYYRQSSAALTQMSFDVLATHGVVCPVGGVHWVQSVHASWLARCRQFRPPWSLGRLRQQANPLHPILLRLEQRHFGERAYRKLIATTPRVREDLQTFYQVPPQDVAIVPNGFNPDEFNPQRRHCHRDEQRKRLGLQDDQIAMLFVANELQRKGYRTILGAMRLLGRRDLRLLVVGKPDRKAVLGQAEEFGLVDQVMAIGPTPAVADYHAAADLFVLPTQYEAFSLAILESLGSGLPVVTSRIPGADDAILPGINGQVIEDPTSAEELAHALGSTLNHAELERLSRQTAQTVEQYQWPRVLTRYSQILAQHADSSKGGSPELCALSC